MTAAHKINIKMGLERVAKPEFATEPDYVNKVNAQMRVLRENLNDIFNQFDDVSPDIILDAMKPTFDKSQMYCPHRSGALRNSGYLESVGFRGKQKVEMGYAPGGNPRYAVLVHEQVEVPHQPPTRSKFLEAAVNEDYGVILDRIAAGYKRFMGT